MRGVRVTGGAHVVYSAEWLLKAVTVIFMVAPAILVVALSFSNEKTLAFPPGGWSTRQYSDFFDSHYWVASVGESFVIAIPAALLATIFGVPAVLALERSKLPGKAFLRTLGLAPLVLPGVVYAIALYALFTDLHLIGTVWGVILANMMVSLPFVLVIVGVGMRRIPADLELVAMSLGASRARATWGITLRLLAPSIAAATVLGFVVSFDDAVLVNFLGGGDVVTLPKAIFDSFRNGINPLITAIATLLMVLTGLMMLSALRLRRGGVEQT